MGKIKTLRLKLRVAELEKDLKLCRDKLSAYRAAQEEADSEIIRTRSFMRNAISEDRLEFSAAMVKKINEVF